MRSTPGSSVRLDASGVCETKAGLGVKRWKANRTHGSAGSSGPRVDRSPAPWPRFPGFAEALSPGSISVDHVLALARVCNDRTTRRVDRTRDTRLCRSRNCTGSRCTARICVVSQRSSTPTALNLIAGIVTPQRWAVIWKGICICRLELSGHNAVEIQGIINTEVDRQYRAAVRESETTGRPVPTTAILRARAVTELLRRGADPNPTGQKPVVSVILPVTVDRDGHPTGVHTLDGTDVDPLTAAVLLCDAFFHRVIVDPSNNPLNMGRTARLFTPAQRKALIVRDGGCIFPGCDQPARRCEAHHRIVWGHDGETNIDDGALICPRHHGLVHCDRPWILLRYDIDGPATAPTRSPPGTCSQRPTRPGNRRAGHQIPVRPTVPRTERHRPPRPRPAAARTRATTAA